MSVIKASSTTTSPEPVVIVPAAQGSFERNLEDLRHAIAGAAYRKAESRGFEPGHELDDWVSAESELIRFVPVEVTEAEDEISIVAEVPGCRANEIEIHLESTRVLIGGGAAQPMQPSGELLYSEREVMPNKVKRIFRAVYLPNAVNPEQASATLTSGVLKLTMPKLQPTKPTRVQVRSLPDPPPPRETAQPVGDPVNPVQGGRMTPSDPVDQLRTPPIRKPAARTR